MNKQITTAAVLLSLAGVTHAAAVSIVEDFEGSTAGSSTVPTGWSLKTMTASAPSYATTSAGQGSNGTGANSGLAGDVSSVAFSSSNLPGAYMVNTTSVDLSQALTGSFDFRIVHESTFDDVGFLLGDVADGITGSSAGELLYVKLTEGGGGQLLVDGSAAAIDSEIPTSNIIDDTWYHATVSWTPTSGTTGNYSFTVNDFSSDVVTLTSTGFTFDSATAQIGFGSVNDTIRFDNVNFTQVPEPSSLALLGLGGMLIARRRRA